jgi:hypothetical protein
MKRNHLLIALATFIFAANHPSKSIAQHPAEKYGWGFRNFVDSSFSWDIFSNSFFGIPADPNLSWTTATFDKLFYDLAFETKLPDPDDNGRGAGNCFGLSLLSLMMNKYGGYYGYCAPPIHYTGDISACGGEDDPCGGPTDPQLRRVINIMHGRQLSLAAIEAYLDQFRQNNSLDASYGVALAQQTIAQEGPCLVGITKEGNPADGSGGHTMIAYEVTTLGPGHFRIWVVDPNRIWINPNPDDRGWYTLGQNYIECKGKKWNFRMKNKASDWPTDGDDDNPGQDPGKGHLVILSPTAIGLPGRVPSSLGLSVLALLEKLIIMN